MKAIAIADLNPAFVERNRSQLAATARPRTVTIERDDKEPVSRAAKTKRIRQNSAGLNKTEAAFLAELNRTRPAQTHLPQMITLRLANGVRYTPDFISVSWTAAGIALTAWETKGFMRDDAAVKVKVAAAMYRFIKFHLVTKRGADWQIQEILP